MGACCALAVGLAAAPALAADASRLSATSHGQATKTALLRGRAARLVAARGARLHTLDRQYRTLAAGGGACAATDATRAGATRLRGRALRGLGEAGPAVLTHRVGLMQHALVLLTQAQASCAGPGAAVQGPPGFADPHHTERRGRSAVSDRVHADDAGGSRPANHADAPPRARMSMPTPTERSSSRRRHSASRAGTVSFHFTNTASIKHNLAIKGAVDAGATADIRNGGSATLTVNLPPGTYEFYCAEPGHEMAGMKGTLTSAEALAAATRRPRP